MPSSKSLSLGQVEASVLDALAKAKKKITVRELVDILRLDQATIFGASTSLSEKNLVAILESEEKQVKLTEEGIKCSKAGLPERIILDYLIRKGGASEFGALKKELPLTDGEATIALGWLRKKNWATATKDAGKLFLKSTAKPSRSADEELIRELSERRELPISSLRQELKEVAELLQKRRLAEVTTYKTRTLAITSNGLEAVRAGVDVTEEVTQLTPEMIRSGDWKTANFKPFDVSAPSEPTAIAKIHPIANLIEEVREIFLELGFEEIKGNLVESAFWNFDALFQPQDHPAREMHDTFYLSTPSMAKLPEQTIVKRIAQTHEDGWETGSTGWGYKWSRDIAQQVILRTHTTATTIKYLASHPTPPIKVFSVDRVYRNEKVNYKHLAEFHQIEGIIMDKDASLADLMGILKEFYNRLGFPKVRFWPSYFPYTEPSAEAVAYVERRLTDQDGKPRTVGKWLELGGMGIFRPEVTLPLGIKHPVLAWGLGLERLFMTKTEADDIRTPYKNELNWLRTAPDMG
ncbi:MAG: phenylalanine--tRNA ligase subunit alpha [Promethearchaeati archaeon SRVP18_Atabeyarchaeia-1]